MKAKPADETYLFSNQDLKRLILPLLVEQLLAITVGMADSIMVSSVGEAAVSGVSLVDTIFVLLINIFTALACPSIGARNARNRHVRRRISWCLRPASCPFWLWD